MKPEMYRKAYAYNIHILSCGMFVSQIWRHCAYCYAFAVKHVSGVYLNTDYSRRTLQHWGAAAANLVCDGRHMPSNYWPCQRALSAWGPVLSGTDDEQRWAEGVSWPPLVTIGHHGCSSHSWSVAQVSRAQCLQSKHVNTTHSLSQTAGTCLQSE